METESRAVSAGVWSLRGPGLRGALEGCALEPKRSLGAGGGEGPRRGGRPVGGPCCEKGRPRGVEPGGPAAGSPPGGETAADRGAEALPSTPDGRAAALSLSRPHRGALDARPFGTRPRRPPPRVARPSTLRPAIGLSSGRPGLLAPPGSGLGRAWGA